MEILDLMFFFFGFDNLDFMYLFLYCILNFKLFVYFPILTPIS